VIELTDKKLKEMCNNYINGNRKDVKAAIKKLNKLQVANFLFRCSNYGMHRHQAYTQVQIALE